MNLEYLRHGKALCGNVFRRFVETFNFHNDFISNLKGDADLQFVGGKVNVDRTDERHPVIRCKGCGGGGGEEYKAVLPWTFSCTEDPETGERTGGWTNCKIQIGYNCSVEDKKTRGENDPRISGTDLTDDGTYYVEVDVKNETAEVKLAGRSGIPNHDLEHDKVNVYIGKVVDGKQEDGIYCIPVIPKYV